MKRTLIRILLIFLISCSSDDNVNTNNPEDITNEIILELNPITEIEYSYVQAQAQVENNFDVPIYSVGFCWSNTPNPTIEDKTLTASLTNGGFSSTINQLEPGTNYYIRAYVSSSHGLKYSTEYGIITRPINIVCEDTYRYVINSRENAKSVTKTYDGGFVIAASFTEYCSCISDTDAVLLKYNSNCELVWEVVLSNPITEVHPNKIIEDSDNNLVMSSAYFGSNGSKSLISKFSSAGNILWETIVDEDLSNQDEKYGNLSLIETIDGGYAMAGNWNLEYTGPGNGDSDFSLIKISRDGELLFKEHYGYLDYIEHALDVIEHPDGDLMLIGQTGMNGSSSRDLKLIKLNSEGVFQWEQIYDRSGSLNHPQSVIKSNDGNFIISGWSNSFNIGHADIWIIKIDWDGNVVWENAIGKPNHFTEIFGRNSIVEAQDGNLLIAAQISDEWEPCPFCGTSETDVFAVKTDSGGNLIWTKTISSLETRSYDGAHSVIELDSGEIVLIGHKQDELLSVLDGAHSDIWIIRLQESE